jgi:Antirestriction protein (ArdA)
MTTFYAQPYDISATGFYFDTVEQYDAKISTITNDYGQPVEEFEIQFIEGEAIDAELFTALSINQCTIGAFLEAIEQWHYDDKLKTIIAVGECGYQFALGTDSPDQFDIDIYEGMTMRDLAIEFIEEGLLGPIPAAIENYIDYDALARDLSMDYAETIIDGKRIIYRSS